MLLKTALRAWLPDSILNRPKMGFALPLGKWISGDLRQFVDGGDSRPLDDMLDSSLFPDLLSRHDSQPAAMTPRVHSLFFLKHWLNMWA